MGLMDKIFDNWPDKFSMHCRDCDYMEMSKLVATEKQCEAENKRLLALMKAHMKKVHGK